MDNQAYSKPAACIFLICIQLFLGIGALLGGLVFIISPSGSLINIPLTTLDQSPFDSFLIPGIILFIVLGIAPSVVGYSLITGWQCKIANRLNLFSNMLWSWSFSLYIGFALIIWIFIQVYLINAVDVLHIIYMTLGLIIQAVTLLPSVQRYYSHA